MNDKTWQRTKTPGLLRHRGGRFYGRFSFAGKTKFVALETDVLEIARIRFSEHKTRVESMRRSARATSDGVGKMGDLLKIFREQLKSRSGITDGTRVRYETDVLFVERTWPDFNALRPEQVDRATVEAWKTRCLTVGTGTRPPGSKEASPSKGKSPRAFNGGFAVVRALLDIAVEKGAIPSNKLAIRGLRLRAKETPRKPKLPPKEKLREIFAEIEAGGGIGGWGREAADFCRLLAFTGCRLAEAGALRWGDIDFDRGVIFVRGTKTDASAREVPLTKAARELLTAVRERRQKDEKAGPADPLLRVKEAQKSLNRACKAVGAERLTHHDLRDAFATTCIEAGVDIPTVASWLGHADGGALLMRVYSHHRRAHSVAQATKVNF